MGKFSTSIGIAVVGYGYWGPNLVRNVTARPEFRLVSLCERDRDRAAEFSRAYPGIAVEPEFDAVLLDPRVDAVAIATPPTTHFSLACRALEAGKHVLVEKPLATTSSHAAELISIADSEGLVLMPAHTFLYSPPVNAVRDLIGDGTLGEPYFVTSSRLNLGNYQRDGVIWDLAPHDISILLHWLDEPVVEVGVSAVSVFDDEVPETAFVTLRFASGLAANVEISWLAPRKVRDMVVVGSKRMIHYEDTAADTPVRVYDRGMEFHKPADFGEYRLTYRSGDMVAPKVEAAEPLGLEFADFARAIRTGEEPVSNAQLGLEVVRAVEAAEASRRMGGGPVRVEDRELVMAGPNESNGNGSHSS